MAREALANEVAVSDLATLRVLADGVRHRVLTLLIKEPLNVRKLAQRLRVPRTRLYYHLELLERHGIIRSVSTRIVAGAIEHTYRAVAKSFRVRRNMLAGTPQASDVDAAQADLLEAVAHDLRTRVNPKDCEPIVARAFHNVTRNGYTELRRRIEALIHRFGQSEHGGLSVEVCVALFPTGGLA